MRPMNPTSGQTYLMNHFTAQKSGLACGRDSSNMQAPRIVTLLAQKACRRNLAHTPTDAVSRRYVANPKQTRSKSCAARRHRAYATANANNASGRDHRNAKPHPRTHTEVGTGTATRCSVERHLQPMVSPPAIRRLIAEMKPPHAEPVSQNAYARK